jgi:hypothetical protein
LLENAGLQVTVTLEAELKGTLILRTVLVSVSGIAMQAIMPDGVPPGAGTTVIVVNVRRVIVGNEKMPGITSVVQMAV